MKKTGNRLSAPYTVFHGQTRRQPIDWDAAFAKPTRVSAVFGMTRRGGRLQLFVMLANGIGHSTDFLDWQELDAWFHAHHPELYERNEAGAEVLDLVQVRPEIFTAFLTQYREKRYRALPRAFEVGCLVDPPALGYLRFANQPTAAADEKRGDPGRK